MMPAEADADGRPQAPGSGTPGEVFGAFLKLGVTSFGGPIAHLGYLHREFVQRRGWLDEAHYAHLLAVCQFLPGPASSQLGFALGLLRAGWRGALAPLPGFLLLLAAQPAWSRVAQHPAAAGAMAGINAAVVGLLLAAFYDPVWREGVRNGIDFSIAVVGFVLLAAVRLPVGWLLLWCVAASLIAASVLP